MTRCLEVERPSHPYQVALAAAHRARDRDRVRALIELIRREQAVIMEGTK